MSKPKTNYKRIKKKNNQWNSTFEKGHRIHQPKCVGKNKAKDTTRVWNITRNKYKYKKKKKTSVQRVGSWGAKFK